MALDTFTLIASQYALEEDALEDYDAVRAAYEDLGIIDTYDAAVVTKGPDGKVRIVERIEEPTRHGAIAGLAVGIPSSHGTPFARFLAPVLPLGEGEHSAGVAFTLLVLSALVAIAGVALAWFVYGRMPVRAASIGVARNPVNRLLLNKYYVDEIYDALIVQPIYRLSLWLARVFDPRVIDGLVNGVAQMIIGWARGLRQLQTGFVMNYALTMLVGAVAVIAFLLLAHPR